MHKKYLEDFENPFKNVTEGLRKPRTCEGDEDIYIYAIKKYKVPFTLCEQGIKSTSIPSLPKISYAYPSGE